MSALTPKEKWPAILRGSLLSAVVSKHVNYVAIADRRAQAIITINTILIPVALAGIKNPLFSMSIRISILTGLLSITAAIISLYPKRRRKSKDLRTLLHFSRIKEFSQQEYLAKMKAAMADSSELAEMVTADIYYLSTGVIVPKFFWLQVSYFLFLFGNAIAISLIIFRLS